MSILVDFQRFLDSFWIEFVWNRKSKNEALPLRNGFDFIESTSVKPKSISHWNVQMYSSGVVLMINFVILKIKIDWRRIWKWAIFTFSIVSFNLSGIKLKRSNSRTENHQKSHTMTISRSLHDIWNIWISWSVMPMRGSFRVQNLVSCLTYKCHLCRFQCNAIVSMKYQL